MTDHSNKYRTKDSKQLVRVEEIYQHVKRYALHTTLADLGVLGMKVFKKDPSISHLLPNRVTEWQLAFIAKALILNSNDHRREQFGKAGLINCVNLYNNLYDKLLELTEEASGEMKLEARNMFLIRTANLQFPFQVNIRHSIPRALILFDEIPSSLKSPSIDIKEELIELYGLTPKQILIIGFAIFASSDKGFLDPSFLINTKSENLRKHLKKENVEKLLSVLTADYTTLRNLFETEEGAEGFQQYAFNSLRTFPIAKTQISGLVVPVPRFLLERITNGIYYSLMDKFSTGKANRFLEFFGKELFERYVGLLLTEQYRDPSLIKEFEYGSKPYKKSPDWIILEGDEAILIECKTSGITKEAKSGAEVEQLQFDLKKRVVHAIIQMNNFVKDMNNGTANYNIDKLNTVKRFHFVVATYDRIFLAGSPAIRIYIDRELEKVGLVNIKYNILGIDEIENLIPNLRNVGLSELIKAKEGNLEWSTWDFEIFVEEYLKIKRVKLEENKFLRDKYESFFKNISPNLRLKESD